MSSEDVPPLQIKANRDGFILVPDPEAPFDSILAYLWGKLRESRDFFKKSTMSLDLRGRSMRTDEIMTLSGALASGAGAKLVEVRLSEDMSLFLDPASVRPSLPPSRPVSAGPPAGGPLLVRSTCRSGTRVESQTDCVVLGDVNPGAEVIAVGDVVIFGQLKGIAHAGAMGSRSARIWALSIESTQIRIADLVALSPRSDKPSRKRYEVAAVEEEKIQVITY